ncbi:MAG: hypothetical protein AB7I08_00645 [Thermoleophilia bacterium]
MDTLADVADRLRPDLVVVCAERIGPIDAVVPCLGALARDHPLALAGRGASAEAAHRAGARLLQDAPMAAAARVAAEMGRREDGPGA